MHELELIVVQGMIRDVACRGAVPKAQHIQKVACIVDALVAQMRDQGMSGLVVPELRGGSYINNVAYALVEEGTSVGSSVGALTCIHSSVACGLALSFNTQAVKGFWLTDLNNGQAIVSYCLAEPLAGSAAPNLGHCAEFRDGQLVLNGARPPL